MDRQQQNDSDAAALVQRSVLFRIARQLFVSLDDAIGHSRLLQALPKRLSTASAGRVVVVASLVHTALVTVVPLPQAPLGRYSLAIAGFIVGVGLIRFRGRLPNGPDIPTPGRARM